MRIEGCIIGFNEYMDLVLDDAEEIHSKTKSRKQLGWIMLKGDNMTLGAGDVAQVVARSPGMRAARVRSSAPHTNKDVVSAEN
uniref:Small nuclear ribonucleoprotein E n=1 Tax=Spermophilus dauricus TaxID=99837 RepID=A0A8C9PUX3_SPEDA